MFKVHNWFAHGKTAWLYWELFGLNYSIDKLLGMCIQFNISPAPPKIIEFWFIGRGFFSSVFNQSIPQRNWLFLSSYWNLTSRLGPFFTSRATLHLRIGCTTITTIFCRKARGLRAITQCHFCQSVVSILTEIYSLDNTFIDPN